MTRDEILRLARTYDRIAEWATDEPDENCLLIAHVPAAAVLDRVGGVWGAYEDPNPAGCSNTRLVFPLMPTSLQAEAGEDYSATARGL